MRLSCPSSDTSRCVFVQLLASSFLLFKFLAGQDPPPSTRNSSIQSIYPISMKPSTHTRSTKIPTTHARMSPNRASKMLFSSDVLVLLLASLPSITALQANANSPCAAQCGNTLASTKGAADIVCEDSQYTSTSAGVTFQSCTNCQLASTYVDPVTNASDLQWALCEYLFLSIRTV